MSYIDTVGRIRSYLQHEFSTLNLLLLRVPAKTLRFEHSLLRGVRIQAPHRDLLSHQWTNHHPLLRTCQIHDQQVERPLALDSEPGDGQSPVPPALKYRAVLPLCNICNVVIQVKNHPRRGWKEVRQRRTRVPLHPTQPTRSLITSE